jgi:hypothetical protein
VKIIYRRIKKRIDVSYRKLQNYTTYRRNNEKRGTYKLKYLQIGDFKTVTLLGP